ncbi:MAG TPA: hypothetical protein P5533_00870 [Candidatus Cloacimonadota bacterium]|nr:hypothetical protein [Candidatus Cloacimonadota bacterium]
MRYLISLALILAALLLVSCDRFTRNNEPIDFNADIFTPLANRLNSSDGTDLSAVMGMYSENYLHNAVNKTQREAFYHSLYSLYGTQISFQPVFTNYNAATQSVNWELQVFATGARNPLQVFAFNDEKIVQSGESWLFVGNQVADLDQGSRRRVFIESFTYTTCPNCPLVEEVMHNLQIQYPAQFSYLEYHIGDLLQAPGNMNIFSYYGPSPMPASVFGGLQKQIGANPEALEAYVSFVLGQLENYPGWLLSLMQYSFTGQTFNGSVVLGPNVNSSSTLPANSKLKFALIEKVSSATNAAGVPCSNVVLASGMMDISQANIGSRIDFSLPFTGTLPSDTSLVVYLQEHPTVFANNAAIHNGIEIPLLNIPTR